MWLDPKTGRRTTITTSTAHQRSVKAQFADTSFWLALINRRDRLHPAAMALNLQRTAPLITTQFVLLEVADGLCHHETRFRFERLLAVLQSSNEVEIVALESSLFDRGCALYFARTDKDWSLTDCISFVVMEERGISEALTADHHYEQAGFCTLLRG